MISDLVVAAARLGGVLPHVRFFETTPEFYRAMEPFRSLTIYDVGAGVGHIARGLADNAHDVVAIDIADRDGACFDVTIANGATYPYQPGSVVLLARPCHGWFVDAVVEHAARCDVRAVVYISKPKNAAGDLGRFRRRFRSDLHFRGRDGERFYLWDRRPR
jgi:hypothetical protein